MLEVEFGNHQKTLALSEFLHLSAVIFSRFITAAVKSIVNLPTLHLLSQALDVTDITLNRKAFYRNLGLRQNVNRVKLEGCNGFLVGGQDLEPGEAVGLVNNIRHVVPFSHAEGLAQINFQTLKFALISSLFVFFKAELFSS